MQRRSRGDTETLFLADRTQRLPVAISTRREPSVGIWWHNQEALVAVIQPLDAFPAERQLVDSNLGHVDEWPLVAKRLGQPVSADYFVLPRGRVLFDRQREIGLIYHGNRTGASELRRIAKVFGLERWEARLDDHYLLGNAADELFEDE